MLTHISVGRTVQTMYKTNQGGGICKRTDVSVEDNVAQRVLVVSVHRLTVSMLVLLLILLLPAIERVDGVKAHIEVKGVVLTADVMLSRSVHWRVL